MSDQRAKTMKIGKIIGVHGINGELRIQPLTDAPERYLEFEEVLLEGRPLAVESARLHQGKVLLTLSGLSNRTQAEKLRGKFIEIERENAQELDEDEFYIVDLLGLEVRLADGRAIGKFIDLLDTTGECETAEISVKDSSFRPEEKTEKRALRHLFLPFREEYFKEIKPEEGYIVVDFPEAFWEL